MPRRTDAELDESTDSIMFPPTVMSKKNEATKAIEALSGSSEAEIATRANEPEPTFHIDISEIPMYERIVRQVDKANEGYYQMHICNMRNKSAWKARNELFAKAVEDILAVGGEIREDWRAQFFIMLYTLPPGVENPINTERCEGVVQAAYFPKLTAAERKIFGEDKQIGPK